MPVIAPPSYENMKAGGALENAAEEILNGIFCHYEPPTSTKAQKTAARAVHEYPTKFLYEEQNTKPVLRKKKIGTPSSQVSEFESEADYETETEAGDYDDETTIGEELEGTEKFEPGTPGKGGIKWRDEESKRVEETKANATKASSWSQYITLPCFTVDIKDDVIPDSLEDIQDENDAPREPTPKAVPTSTRSALKRRDDAMKVLYDDEGNPNTTPKSPGSIRGHAFFRNVTNSPRTPGMYEPKDYNKPSTPKAKPFQMHRDYTPRPLPAPPSPATQTPIVAVNTTQTPGSPGVTDYDLASTLAIQNSPRIRAPLPGSPGITDQLGGPQVIRLAKVGRNPRAPAPLQTTMAPTLDDWAAVDPAASPARSFIAKSPKQYMARVAPVPVPVNAQPEVNEQQKSVIELVQVLNKAGFNPGKRFSRAYTAKSFRQPRAPRTPSTSHHGYASANDNRGPLQGESKPSFVGTRRVAVPAPLVTSNPSPREVRPTRYQRPMALNTTNRDVLDALEMARDPTPRQKKIQELDENLRRKAALPPTPRRKAEEPEPVLRSTPTVQKPPQHFVQTNAEGSNQRRVKIESRQQPKSSSKKEKKGFMSGIKKGFGKFKSVVNDIDSQRIQEPISTSNKKSSSSRSGRQVRMS